MKRIMEDVRIFKDIKEAISVKKTPLFNAKYSLLRKLQVLHNSPTVKNAI